MADVDTHIRRGQPIFMGVIIVFGIIEGALTSWLVMQYNNNDSYPNGSIRDRVRFLVFTSWWTVVFAAVYLALFLTAAESMAAGIASHGIFITLTWLFWLAGAAAITTALGGGLSCNNTVLAYCSQLNATIAFAWIEWLLFTLLLIVILIIGGTSLRRGDRLSGGLVA